MRVFDLVPFFNELDLLEIRMAELQGVVTKHIVVEARETYGGQPKSDHQQAILHRFSPQIDAGVLEYRVLDKLLPACVDRTSGRLREVYQRNQMTGFLMLHGPCPNDVILFSDLDEIPRASSVQTYLDDDMRGVHRFKQISYYYDVNTVVDYGHDWASRARIGRFSDLQEIGYGLYDFRMLHKNTEKYVLEQGGWHFSYFGGMHKIEEKVAALSPFLSEYKLFGRSVLQKDINEGRDLHHRRCELPEQFTRVPIMGNLPKYLLENIDKFPHFLAKGYEL